ncbi:unnamed protein product [Peronospora belbahrii]|uniref:Protein kinase domain-containing protein n=1 Tax=Peronospora belbahrii TaxID=622444 RepID=A0AAU9KJZ6_9STRA|nr:unnamed protein product [Peronospora belbahrii]
MPSFATKWTVKEVYSGSHCAGTPKMVEMTETTICDVEACMAHDLSGYTLFESMSCNIDDRFTYTEERFAGFSYVVMARYGGVGCQRVVHTTVYPASGICKKSSILSSASHIVNLCDNGTTAVKQFENGDCAGEPSQNFQLDNEQIVNGDCIQTPYSWSAITAITAGAIACIAFLAFATFKYNPQAPRQIQSPTRCHVVEVEVVGCDEIIVTARVPRENVILHHLVSRGGYGEVYSGLFNNEHVAIKMQLLELRKSINHLNSFLAEVKLMATLNHERIVQFAGVAWDSLTDLCVLFEYMEGGDLRNLLKNCEEHNTPLSFDQTKATIALHVAHSLTHLHSLSSPVLHRDLKSKNILLTAQLEAKLTDFGVSRERSDFTMTGGVGSSRWMAPEVMMGDRYDDKADMFSFGVVLAELDHHLLPYANARIIAVHIKLYRI